MREDDVVTAFVAALEADAALIAALGGEFIFRAGANREPQIPSVEWDLVANTEEENLEPLLFQFDIWARGYAQFVTIAQRVRTVLRPDPGKGSTTLGGIPMLIEFVDGRSHPDPEPGVVHRSLDIRFQPAKQVA